MTRRVTYLAALACAVGLAPGLQAGPVWDLKADWSDEDNPNGPWAYRGGDNLLGEQENWLGLGQPGWADAASGRGHVPIWYRRIAALPPGASDDFQVGDILVHAWDESSGGSGRNPANVTWTSPLSGVFDVDLSIWIAIPQGRFGTWTLLMNGSTLASGNLNDSDPYSSSSPAGYAGRMTLSTGDVLRLDWAESVGGYGPTADVNFRIEAVPEPLTWTLLLPALAGLLIRRRKA